MLDIIKKVMSGSIANQDGKVDMLDKMLAVYDRKMENLVDAKLPAPTAPPRTPFTPDIPASRASMANLAIQKRLKMLPTMLSLMWNMWRSSRFYQRSFQPTTDKVSEQWVTQLEALAREHGAADIAYVKVPPRAIFQHLGIPHEYAVVFTIEMDPEPIKTAPSFECFLEVAKGYRKLALISNKLTRFMRQSGVAAYPGTALGGLTDYSHIAELAGLGTIGYHGLLITPKEGARLRINSIYTNAVNLPIKEENPHHWVRDFCSKCRRCIRKCPPQAIFESPRPRSGGGMQCIDHKSCRDYFAEHFGCAICLKECPFSHAGYEKIHQRFKGAPEAPVWSLLGEEVPRETERLSKALQKASNEAPKEP